MANAVIPPTDLSSAIAFYTAFNIPITPVRPGDKAGRLEGWSKPGHNAAPTDFKIGNNIGVLNGTEPIDGWFFHDVDLDVKTEAGRTLLQRLLPPTGWRYGRRTNPRSH